MSAPDDPEFDFSDLEFHVDYDDSDADRDCDADRGRADGRMPPPAEPAVREEWPIPESLRNALISRQWMIAVNKETKISDAIAATRSLIMMNAQNLTAYSLRKSQHFSHPGNANGLSSSPEQRELEIDSLFDRIASEERRAADCAAWKCDAGPLADLFEGLPDAEGTGGDEAA